ncbi:hypothetical protein GCM10010289_80580 [Streptomyces violascens]|uniref:Transposase n=1 Tax=Streptomyces violascens TaxID=67381 RepID=A0ABQ3QS95_9ACTN|nr:hypothetical protein GCM10010289_80580 [Streptomyces violascens]GHI40161.1 hypothetical protein Sviol_45690 [Streptomyces violascens]
MRVKAGRFDEAGKPGSVSRVVRFRADSTVRIAVRWGEKGGLYLTGDGVVERPRRPRSGQATTRPPLSKLTAPKRLGLGSRWNERGPPAGGSEHQDMFRVALIGVVFAGYSTAG